MKELKVGDLIRIKDVKTLDDNCCEKNYKEFFYINKIDEESGEIKAYSIFQDNTEEGAKKGIKVVSPLFKRKDIETLDEVFKDFDIQGFLASEIYVRCKSENESKIFLMFLNKHGFVWKSGRGLSGHTYWGDSDDNGIYYSVYEDKKLWFTVRNTCVETQIIEFSDIINSKPKKERYVSTLYEFNFHKWIKFYEDEEGEPNIEWAEGCHEKGISGLESFEKRVKETYNVKDNIIYRTYMLEADKIRLALLLPPRRIGNMAYTENLNSVLEEKKEILERYITIENMEYVSDYYTPKNILWVLVALRNIDNEEAFTYVILEDNYYDLITVSYLEKNFSIPTCVLANILEIKTKQIYDLFKTHKSEKEIDFI